MVRFSIFGIQVTVQPFFWVTMIIIGILWNPDAMQTASPSAFLEVGLFTIAGFVSILIHELGHALTAKKFGSNVHIVLETMGGYAAYSGAHMTRTKTFLITAAGPAIQIALAAVVWVAMLQVPYLTPHATYFLNVLIGISLIWAIFNLMPVLPLDGGRMVESLLGPRRIKLTLWISTGVAAALAVFGLMSGAIFMTVIMGMFSYQSYKALKQISWR